MFVPFISTRSPASKKSKSLERRRGGGGGGRGGGGGGRGGGGGVGGGGSGGGRTNVAFGGGGSRPVSPYGNGGGSPITIPAGQVFAGRSAGGGTRAQVYGNSQYGSGYPGFTGRGIATRPLPFYFWPLLWGGSVGGGYYYLNQHEPDVCAIQVIKDPTNFFNQLGSPDNSSRPGGAMASAFFISNSTNTTLRILADNYTVSELITDVTTGCGQYFGSNSSTSPSPYLNNSTIPSFDQVIQYYRASSVALTLDGYNNTADYKPEGTPDTPFQDNVDTTLLHCMNDTIGAAVPLVDGAMGQYPIPTIGLFGLVGLVLSLSSFA